MAGRSVFRNGSGESGGEVEVFEGNRSEAFVLKGDLFFAGQHSVFQRTIGLVGGKDGLQVFVFRGFFVFLQKMVGEFFFIGNDQLDHQGGDIVCGIEYRVFFVDFVGTQETNGFSLNVNVFG